MQARGCPRELTKLRFVLSWCVLTLDSTPVTAGEEDKPMDFTLKRAPARSSRCLGNVAQPRSLCMRHSQSSRSPFRALPYPLVMMYYSCLLYR